MVDIFERLEKNAGGPIGQYMAYAHGYFAFPKLEGEIGPHMTFRGKKVLNWSLNNYLGLANHPEVRITYEFNGENYAVEYKLYRNMYPHTVRRFVELSENGFYDNMIIHNYQTNDWFTGGYTYNEADYSANVDNAGQMSDYFDTFSKEEAYNELFTAGKLSASVYSNVRYDDNGKTSLWRRTRFPRLWASSKTTFSRKSKRRFDRRLR